MIVSDEYLELLTKHRPELPRTAAEHGRMVEVPALEMLLHLVEEHGLRQADFVAALGSRPYVSQIFTGRRKITRGVAEKLAGVLKVSAATFHII